MSNLIENILINQKNIDEEFDIFTRLKEKSIPFEFSNDIFLKKVIDNIDEYGMVPERTLYYLVSVFLFSKKDVQFQNFEIVTNHIIDCKYVENDFKKFLLTEIKDSINNEKGIQNDKNNNWEIFMKGIFNAHSPEEKEKMFEFLNVDNEKNKGE